MIIAGGYLFLDSIQVTNIFSIRHSLYSVGGYGLTTGILLIPFFIGIGLIFYNGKSILGWVVAGGSLLAIIIGMIASLQFVLVNVSALDFIIIAVLLFGGIGLFLRSLRNFG
jgi:hypothetical protein